MEKIAFLSDFHLGINAQTSSFERESALVDWFTNIGSLCNDIYLMGDVFDFWFEYKQVIPKGYIRFFSALVDMRSKNINIHLFIGNHDMWIFDYLQIELGVIIYRDPITLFTQNKTLFLGHGDGLGPGDHAYKFLKKIFRNPLSIFLFKWVHPDIGILIANKWSKSSRIKHGDIYKFGSKESEFLIQFCEHHNVMNNNIDYYIFGHRHLPIDYQLNNQKARYINLGDWIKYFSYALLEQGEIKIYFHTEDQQFKPLTNEDFK